MDFAALQRVVDAESDEVRRVYGVFDPARVPALDIYVYNATAAHLPEPADARMI
jgi:hypothetical protein